MEELLSCRCLHEWRWPETLITRITKHRLRNRARAHRRRWGSTARQTLDQLSFGNWNVINHPPPLLLFILILITHEWIWPNWVETRDVIVRAPRGLISLRHWQSQPCPRLLLIHHGLHHGLMLIPSWSPPNYVPGKPYLLQIWVSRIYLAMQDQAYMYNVYILQIRVRPWSIHILQIRVWSKNILQISGWDLEPFCISLNARNLRTSLRA